MLEVLVIKFIELLMRLLCAWLAWLLANWIGLPEWGVITFVVLAVTSTSITYRRK